MQEATHSPDNVLHMLLERGGATFYDRVLEELDKRTFIGGRPVARQKLTPLNDRAAGTVHVIKVSLYGAKPPVWRRLEVPSAMTLDRLHEVLQAAFEWEDSHLHQFETVCGEFGNPGQAAHWSELSDESAVALGQVARTERAKAVYLYDFGDDWRHDIVVEKILPAVPGVAYPRCTGGKGAGPEEDSGGIWVFNDERADEGRPRDRFDPGQAAEALAGLARVIVPAAAVTTPGT
jgi:hypothetical protein